MNAAEQKFGGGQGGSDPAKKVKDAGSEQMAVYGISAEFSPLRDLRETLPKLVHLFTAGIFHLQLNNSRYERRRAEVRWWPGWQ
jgi:hypothetical protein